MKKVSDILQASSPSFSLELFPPKTDEGYQNLLKTIQSLVALRPDFFSCTYGAGGGSRERTLDVVEHIQKEHGIPAVAHLTCVLHTKAEMAAILADMQGRGIRNVLALRGDPPKDNPGWTPGPENFRYSSELCSFIRRHHAGAFAVGVAGFPEGHLLCPDRNQDALYLKMKIDSGADFVVTQLFFKNQDYFDYVTRLRRLGVTVPVLPGLLPVTNYEALLRFCGNCGTTVPDEVRAIFEPLAADPEATLKAGIAFAVRQGLDLLAHGAPGLHFYALNKIHPVDTIIRQIRAQL